MRHILLFVLALAASTAVAKDVVLYSIKGKPARDYNQIKNPKNLVPGDVLIFSDGARFEYLGHLGTDGSTSIFKARDLAEGADPKPIALRVAKTRDRSILFVSHRRLITHTIKGERDLRENGVPIPKIFKSREGEYVALELIDFQFSAAQFLYDPAPLQGIYFGTGVMNEAEEALVEFAVKTAAFYQIGDFRSDQLVYVVKEKRWILLDWTKRHIMNSKSAAMRRDRGQSLFNNTFRVNEVAVGNLTNPLWQTDPKLLERWKRILDRLDDARYEAFQNSCPAPLLQRLFKSRKH